MVWGDMRTQQRVLAAAVGLMGLVAVARGQGVAVGSGANLGLDGRVTVVVGGEVVGVIAPMVANREWSFGSSRPAGYRQEGEVRRFGMRIGEVEVVKGEARVEGKGEGVEAGWVFEGVERVDAAALGVTMDFQAGDLMGGTWNVIGGAAGELQPGGTFKPERGETRVFEGQVRGIEVTTRSGKTVQMKFDAPTTVVVQDNRQWTQTFSIRVGSTGMVLEKGGKFEVGMMLGGVVAGVGSKMTAGRDGVVTIVAGEDWVPLRAELEIEKGSALDLSGMGFVDGPTGKHGRVVVNAAGRFAFENSREKAQKFYGVNFCFGAQYLEKEEVDRLADRLVRLGYNTVRIHHYEGGLTNDKPGFEWDAKKLDQLDYLVAAMMKRGIYVTTDLYVSRPVSAGQVGMPGDASWAYKVKVLIPVHEPAMEDWKAFSRKLLEHVNPYTGKRWADEEGIAWLSLINEGNVGNFWNDVKGIPQWKTAWNVWLGMRYGSRESLAANWGEELKEGEAAIDGTVALPASIHGETVRHRDVKVFVAEVEREMYVRMERFLREEIKTKALLTNLNAWTNHVPNQMVREKMDYVDDHFYVDHPEFLERDWSLPSRSANSNPVKQGAPGGRGGNLVRMWGKPFTVSEYNYSGPGRFRGVGGILTGAMGAIQGWDVIWRFAYSHGREAMFTPGRMGYFDLAGDPLNQAADRAAVMLFLRGDLAEAKGKVAVVLSRKDMERPGVNRVPQVTEGPNWLAWVTGVGSAVEGSVPEGAVVLPTGWGAEGMAGPTAFGTTSELVMEVLRQRGLIKVGNRTDPARNVFESDTGEMLLDGEKGVLRFDTPKTAGGYAEPGEVIESANAGVVVSELSIGATVFVTSVDGKAIRESGRLLVTHLTDLQNTETVYAEQARQTLLDWGKMPHLVRAGTAKVRIAVKEPGEWKVYGLSVSGKREGEVTAKVVEGGIEFTCDVKGEGGARMLYEIVRR